MYRLVMPGLAACLVVCVVSVSLAQNPSSADDDVPATKVKHVDPVYPPLARSARVEGAVLLQFLVTPGGKVSRVEVLRSVPPLDAAAIAAVQQWEYTPATRGGTPWPSIKTAVVNFTLDRSAAPDSADRGLPISDAASPSQDAHREASQLFQAGRYDLAAGRLVQHLVSVPTDAKAKAILALAYLRSGNAELATEQYEQLLALSRDPTAALYAASVKRVIDERKALTDVVGAVVAALERLDPRAAEDRIDSETALKPDARRILRFYVRANQAHFARARVAVQALQSTKVREALLKDLADRQAVADRDLQTVWFTMGLSHDGEHRWWPEYQALRSKARRSGVYYTPEEIDAGRRADQFLLARFAEAVSRVQRAFPLAEAGLEAVLLGHLIFRPYEEFERLADRVMAARGHVDIPAGMWGTRTDVLRISRQARTISLLDKCTGCQNTATRHPPFEVSFDKLRTIEHEAKVQSRLAGPASFGLRGLEMLILTPGGKVQTVAASFHVEGAYGPQAVVDIANKLGRYVLHVVNRSEVKHKTATLRVDSGSGFLRAFQAAGAALAAQTGNVGSQTFFEGQLNQSFAVEQQTRAHVTALAPLSAQFRVEAARLLDDDWFADIDQLVTSLQ
jgi:TonB family protein